jgi:hypothetical protein
MEASGEGPTGGRLREIKNSRDAAASVKPEVPSRASKNSPVAFKHENLGVRRRRQKSLEPNADSPRRTNERQFVVKSADDR